jgi:hypothetical protein
MSPIAETMLWAAGAVVFVVVWQWVADRTWAKPKHPQGG